MYGQPACFNNYGKAELISASQNKEQQGGWTQHGDTVVLKFDMYARMVKVSVMKCNKAGI